MSSLVESFRNEENTESLKIKFLGTRGSVRLCTWRWPQLRPDVPTTVTVVRTDLTGLGMGTGIGKQLYNRKLQELNSWFFHHNQFQREREYPYRGVENIHVRHRIDEERRSDGRQKERHSSLGNTYPVPPNPLLTTHSCTYVTEYTRES